MAKQKRLSNYHLLIPFIFVDLIIFCVSYFWGKGIEIEQFVLLNLLPLVIMAFLLLKHKLRRLLLVIVLLTPLNMAVSFGLLFATMFIPGSKQHDYVMYSICLPAIKRYYDLPVDRPFPAGEVDASGWGRWWYQHSECEKNVRNGKGTIFSDNPPEFIPLKK